MSNISSAVVDEALTEGKGVDRKARIETLNRELAKVQKDITEQQRVEKRLALVNSAYAKLKRELGKTLTPEEYEAIDGIYLFLHSGCVDMVRNVPSATSKGEDRRLEKDLHTAESLHELASLTK